MYADLIGVAGGARGLALDGVTRFTAINSPNHGDANGISTLAGLADYLVGEQNADGSWNWHSDSNLTGDGNKDTQTTAYCVLALEAVGKALSVSDYDDEVFDGRTWLVTMQENSDGNALGAFYSYPGDSLPLNNEVSGEATAALPEPATMGLLAIGGLGVLIRRRRRRA